MINKKEIEKLAVKSYLTASYQTFEIEDFESPDFILRNSDLTIGCEVTDFHPDYSSKGSNLHKRESFINDLHDRMRTKIKELFPLGYSFWISYQSEKSENSKIDSEVELLQQKIIENIDSSVIKNPSINVRLIFISKIENLTTKVNQMVATDYQTPKPEWIKSIIEAKTEIMDTWKGGYDEKWLLISVGLSRSGDLNLKKLKLSSELNCNDWNKIILIDVRFSEYLDINAT